MAKAILSEKQRAAIAFRLAGVNVKDTPIRRKVDRLYDALKLDDLADGSMAKLERGSTKWDAATVEYPITSEQRDNLIEWLTPTEMFPMNGYMGRILGGVLDALTESRDGKRIEAAPTEPAPSNGAAAQEETTS